jgi:hypothetical protein
MDFRAPAICGSTRYSMMRTRTSANPTRLRILQRFFPELAGVGFDMELFIPLPLATSGRADPSDILRSMAEVRIESVADPFSEDDPELGEAFLDVLLRADSMGLIAEDVRGLDRKALRAVGKAVAEQGIGQAQAVEALTAATLSRPKLLEVLEQWKDALEESPVPSRELPALIDLFGLEELAALLDTSTSSLRRYASGQRSAPDVIAARAHFLSGVVGDLRGAYNEFGVRRWFVRERSALGGRSPKKVLRKGWDPDSPDVRAVRDLARALVASPAT